jgi:serine-aspartate repeat-containing protein C/D/E
MNLKQFRTERLYTLVFSLLFCSFTLVTSAADWYVSTTGNDAATGTPANPWRTVSHAISMAADGDIIHIGAGTFTEQLEISKNLTLIGTGANQTRIIAPSPLPLSFYAGMTYFPVVYVHDVSAANIKGLTIDGANSFTDLGAAFTGIAYLNAGGAVENCNIVNIMTSPAYASGFGYGMFVYAESNTARTVTVLNSGFATFQKMAAGFWGKDLTVNFEGNTIEGAGMITAIAQNGVQFSQQTTGAIRNNNIKNVNYAAYDQSSTAILVNEARSPVTISGNNILDCQTGIYCIKSGGTTISQNKLVFSAGNYSDDIDYWWGILVRNGSYTIKENEIDGGGGGTGIDGFSYANETTFITATNNLLKNLETGISTEVEETPACVGGKIQYNSITNTLEPLYNNQQHNDECPVPDAPCNWYGSADEEDFTPGTEGPGHIIGDFKYQPWLTNGTDAQPAVIGFQALPNVCNGKPCKDLEEESGLKETFPYTFNTGFYKSLYNKTFTGSTGTWTATSNENATIVVTKPYYSPSSSYALKVVNYKTYNCGSGWAKAVSPKLNLTGPCCPDNLKFNFTLWTYNVVCNDTKAKLEIDFSADNGATWTEVWSKTSGQLWSLYGDNGKALINIPVATSYQNSNFRYRIRGEMAAGDYNNFYVFIDDIHFTSPAVCPPLGSIGDYVWKDVNANGKQDAGEPGIPNVTVKLTLPNGTAVTKTTDAAGGYLFTGLAAGSYSVAFTTPAGFEPTVANSGADDALDSDPVNGLVAVSLGAGQNNKTIDAGFKVQACTNTVSHKETFPAKFNTYINTSLYNKTFVGSTGTWTVASNDRGSMAVVTPYYAPSSSYALKVVNFNTNGCGAGWTKAVSPKVDLSDPCCPSELTMTFTLWTYKVVAADYKAKLEIDFSNNNGSTWTEVWSKTSAQLHYDYGANGKTTVTISVPVAYQNSNFRYRIRGEMAAGDYNNFYVFIDDIKIASPATCTSGTSYVANRTTGNAQPAADVTTETSRSKDALLEAVKETKADFSVTVFPNPSADQFELRMTSKESEAVSIKVVDMLGRVVKTMRIAPNSSTRFGADFRSGTYLVEIQQGEKKETLKLLKQ